MAGHPLRSAIHRRLGKPLPYQLANETQAHLSPDLTPLTPLGCPSVVLCGISRSFPLLSPCDRQVAHALLTSPPLTCYQHKNTFSFHVCFPCGRGEKKSSIFSNALNISKCLCADSKSVRLACLKHAASVRPEPGSNSNVLISIHLSM